MSISNTVTELNHQLDRWLRRYRWQRAVRWSPRGAALGLAISLLLTLVAMLRGLILQSEFVASAIGLMLIGSIGAALAGYGWPLDRRIAARRFDRRFGLSERISTALELAQLDRPFGEIEQRQLQDAAAAAQRVDAQRQLPLRIRRVDALLPIALLAAVLLVAWRGEAFFQMAAQTRAVQQAIAQESAQVEALRQHIATDPNLTEEQRRQLLDALQETQGQLQAAQSPEQATAVLTRGEKQFESLTSAEADAQASALRQAGQHLSQAEGSPLQTLGQNLAEGDFLAAAENLRNIDVSQLSAEEAAALANQLDNLAEAAQANNPQLAQQLRDAASAVRRGDTQQAQQALEQAAQSMTKTAQQVARSNVARQVSTQMEQGRQRMIAAGRSAQSQTAQGNPSGAGANSPSGQGNPTGQGAPQAGSSTQNGSGASGSGAGKGTGSSDTRGPEASSNPIAQNNGPGDGGETTYEPIYSPQRLGGAGTDTVVLPGSNNPTGDITGQGGVASGANTSSRVPYTQVFAQYANAYRQAIESGQVPPQFRDLIKQYFSSLEP